MTRFRRLSDLNDPPPYLDPRWNLFLPPAPTGVTASAGNAQATVSWTAPSVVSATPITDYVVQYSSNSGSSWTTFSDGTSTTASATVTGLTNGTAYQFRVAAVNAIGQGAWSTASSAVTPQSGDPLFSKVSLLLHMDGSGSTFVDSSKYGAAITAYGNATQSATQSKWGGRSAYFDGDGDGLVVPRDTSLQFGAGDFCIEMWVRLSSRTALYPCLFANYLTYKTNGIGLFAGHASGNTGKYQIDIDGVSFPAIQSTADIAYGTWQHLAVSRSGNTVSLYVDGQLQGTANTSASLSGNGSYFSVGVSSDALGNPTLTNINGYIDDVRVTKGAARYTGATITVPTTAFPEAVAGADPWIDNVSLLLHADGTGSTFVDSSPTPKTITAFGNATQSTAQSKWGGKSAYFDGSGDYLTTPANAAYNLSGDWTIEFWVRFAAAPNVYAGAYGAAIVNCYQGSGASGGPGWQVRINGNSSSYTTINLFTGSTDLNWSYGTFTLNQWYYIALSRQSGVIRAYVDGTRVGSEISNSDSMSSSNQLSVGRLALEPVYLFDINGYIDDLRITKGSARGYTGSTITVPTAAFPDA